jgi:TRAP-type C4-dicarboxylate transport system permease small subunit
MYLQILNVLLILILIGLLVWLGWNVYQSSQPITKYEAPEFPEGFGIEPKIELYFC